MSIYGKSIEELTDLVKKFRENKEFLGLSDSEVAKMLNIPEGEIKYLLTMGMVNFQPPTGKGEKLG